MRQKQRVFSLFLLSPSSRRAWIEIQTVEQAHREGVVALLAEGVDRNIISAVRVFNTFNIALLAEGVDRNSGYKIA